MGRIGELSVTLKNLATKIPTSVKIGPFTYAIDIDVNKFAACKLQNEDKYELAGMTCTADQVIHIDIAVPMEKIQDTVLHEILHAIYFISSLHEIKKPSEEIMVAIFATNLMMVLKDNPHIVQFLFDKGEV